MLQFFTVQTVMTSIYGAYSIKVT